MLEQGFKYRYTIGEVTEVNTDITANVSGDDSTTFNVPYSAEESFDINAITLDNNNFFTGGERIHKTNTAGEERTNSESNSSTFLILPKSVKESLKNFNLRKTIVTQNNVENTQVQNYQVIKNGDAGYNFSLYHTFSLAENEHITFDGASVSVLKGLNQSDGHVYRFNINEYMYDNQIGKEYSIQFEYYFETKAGYVETGTITLPVQ